MTRWVVKFNQWFNGSLSTAYVTVETERPCVREALDAFDRVGYVNVRQGDRALLLRNRRDGGRQAMHGRWVLLLCATQGAGRKRGVSMIPIMPPAEGRNCSNCPERFTCEMEKERLMTQGIMYICPYWAEDEIDDARKFARLEG